MEKTKKVPTQYCQEIHRLTGRVIATVDETNISLINELLEGYLSRLQYKLAYGDILAKDDAFSDLVIFYADLKPKSFKNFGANYTLDKETNKLTGNYLDKKTTYCYQTLTTAEEVSLMRIIFNNAEHCEIGNIFVFERNYLHEVCSPEHFAKNYVIVDKPTKRKK